MVGVRNLGIIFPLFLGVFLVPVAFLNILLAPQFIHSSEMIHFEMLF